MARRPRKPLSLQACWQRSISRFLVSFTSTSSPGVTEICSRWPNTPSEPHNATPQICSPPAAQQIPLPAASKCACRSAEESKRDPEAPEHTCEASSASAAVRQRSSATPCIAGAAEDGAEDEEAPFATAQGASGSSSMISSMTGPWYVSAAACPTFGAGVCPSAPFSLSGMEKFIGLSCVPCRLRSQNAFMASQVSSRDVQSVVVSALSKGMATSKSSLASV
mmetsp:Transcript_72414/g.159969  ORF Transcript_72414/g.159969 Transcript_72414/m.159969 type:complete len:222 (-) Transcript_72414:1386-2051(-)